MKSKIAIIYSSFHHLNTQKLLENIDDVTFVRRMILKPSILCNMTALDLHKVSIMVSSQNKYWIWQKGSAK
ncbi:hypothetical protein ACVRW4_07965 [Streptococcus phocae subsp. phocae]